MKGLHFLNLYAFCFIFSKRGESGRHGYSCKGLNLSNSKWVFQVMTTCVLKSIFCKFLGQSYHTITVQIELILWNHNKVI